MFFSSDETSRLRQHARMASDPNALLARFASLRMRDGFTLCSYPYRVFEGRLGNVWAVPISSEAVDPEECETIDLFELPRPFPTYNTCLDGLRIGRSAKLIRPPRALDNVMDAIEGDGTPYSYLSASIFAREVAEFGASWHGLIWSTHTILTGDPWACLDNFPKDREPSPEQYWQWPILKPSEWSPSVECDSEVVTVKFFTYTGLVRETVYCFVDTYERGNYRFEWDVKTIGQGELSYLL